MEQLKKTPSAELLRLARQEQADRELNIQWLRKHDAASKESGFSGELRRAIDAARIPSAKLAAACRVDVMLLEDFRAGEATLPSDAVNRLVELLKLRLVPAESAS